MGEFSFWHLILILGVVLIFFGPSRLPGLGNSLGKAIRGFKEGVKGLDDDVNGTGEKDARTNRDSLPSSDHTTNADRDKNKNSSNT